ncbi:MAG: squalene/phytoene synthase family protein [Chloroflexota bacterium]|jgi:farnesyl-diphosphate farnesyltransferase
MIVATELTKQEYQYLDAQMKRVSRSFALVVSYIEEPLKAQLATAYLICRVVDNIEDCTEPYAWQEERFKEFSILLNDPGAAREILTSWGSEPWPGLTDDEKKLMGPSDGRMLWQIYGQMSEEVRQTINQWSLTMAHGMNQIENPQASPLLVSRNGIQVLNSESDYNKYCYYVAGTVGHMATELAVANYGFSSHIADTLSGTCEACGRGLQKTNIIKDFPKDVSRGVSYVPDEWLEAVGYRPLSLNGAPSDWKQMVLSNVFGELREATQYVLAVPYEAIDYRIASLLCLFPAYQTLLQAAERQAKLFTTGHQVKISRITMVKCIKDAIKLAVDNDAILAYSKNSERSFEGLFELAQS